MIYFMVLSVNKIEQKSLNFIKASSYDHLFKKLEREKLYPVRIVELPTFLIPTLSSSTPAVSSQEIVEMLNNLHLVVKSGLPIYEGVLDLAQDSANREFKNMLFQIADDINSGKSLSEAFELYKDVVGVMILNLIKIGEETGSLEFTLKRGATFLHRISSLKKRAASALIYPSFAFLAVMGAMLVWMIYVLPQMSELFKEMEIELPTMTIVLMKISDFVSNYIGYVLIGIVIVVVTFRFAHKNSKSVRFYTDKYMLKIPVINQIILSFNTAFITEYLRLALVSGIPVFNALETLSIDIENEIFQKALQDAKKDVANGDQLSMAFSKTDMFPPFSIRMMSVGENTGKLDSQLDIIANHYYEKVDFFAENIGKVIEPLVLIIVGGFMAIVMLGLMGPMYDLVSKVR